jgi:ATP synthase protein I
LSGPDDELSSYAKTYRAAAPWLNASAKLTTGPLLGVLVGWYIDKAKGTGPYGVLIGSIIGIAAGFYGFIRDVLKMSEKKKQP